jgi:hypothetical protein
LSNNQSSIYLCLPKLLLLLGFLTCSSFLLHDTFPVLLFPLCMYIPYNTIFPLNIYTFLDIITQILCFNIATCVSFCRQAIHLVYTIQSFQVPYKDKKHVALNRSTWYHGWVGHYATSWKVAGSIPYEGIGFFSWPNPSSHTVVQGSTQPLTEMSTRNLLGDKGQPARKADNLTNICELIV